MSSRTKPTGENRFLRPTGETVFNAGAHLPPVEAFEYLVKEAKKRKEKLTELPQGYIKVLDKGYVGLLGAHGSDRGKVSPPNAARTSFKKDSSEFTDEQNDRLTHYLMRQAEFACFRHNVMTFEIRFPLFVARQWWKYVVGSNFTEDQLGWNENSKRYITEDNEFYIPRVNEWRSAPENKKQGSGEALKVGLGQNWTLLLEEWCQEGELLYQKAVSSGIAPEQARLFTSNGVYVTVQWTTSLNALLHFLDERLDEHAQWEIRQYAQVVEEFFRRSFPVVHEAWKEYVNKKINDSENLKYALEENQKLRKEIARLNSLPWYKKVFS